MASNKKKGCKIALAAIAVLTILAAAVVYSGYLDYKRTLLAAISDKMTSFAGQQVTVEDMSLSMTAGIRLHNIVVGNPDGFGSGQLLRIKSIKLDMQPAYLFGGSLHFKNISIDSPELTLMRNSRGMTNVSGKLRAFLSKKSSLKYHVDKLAVGSGSFEYNGDRTYRLADIDLTIKNLSAGAAAKTDIEGSAVYAGTSKIKLAGWVSPGNESKGFNISAFSDNFSLRPLSRLLKTPALDAGKASMMFDVNIAGDMKKGVTVKSDMRLRNLGAAFVKKDMDGMHLGVDAFYNTADGSVRISELSLYAGGSSAVRLSGAIKDITKSPAYDIYARIERFDLSALNAFEGVRLSGIVTSDDIAVKGRANGTAPAISGNVRVRHGAVQTKSIAVEAVNADMDFSHGSSLPSHAELSGRIARAGEYIFRKPAEMKLLISARSSPAALDLTAAADIAPFELIKSGGDRVASLGRSRLAAQGTLRGERFTGKSTVDLRELSYGKYVVRRLSGSSGMDYGKDILTLSSLALAAESFKASAGIIKAVFGENGEYTLSAHAMNAEFPGEKAGIAGLDMKAAVKTGGRFPSGDFALSAEKLGWHGIKTGGIALSGDFDDKRFSVAVSRAELFGGNCTLDAHVAFTGRDVEFRADAAVKNVKTSLDGTVKELAGQGRTARVRIILPETRAAEIRDSLWDLFPDNLLYAGIDGSLSSELLIEYGSSGIKVGGAIAARDIMLTGENGEYAAGPINGSIPISYDKVSSVTEPVGIPAFERSEFEGLVSRYSSAEPGAGFSKITIGRLEYGFRLLDNVELRIRQKGTVLHIERFSANIFGGKIFGSAVADISDGLSYRAGMLVKGLSMTALGNDIVPVKGYISGKVDGLATLKGEGGGLARLIGKADFWTYSTKAEKTKISREFLRKVGGPSVKTYLRDRPFDKGTMSLYLQDGFVIFRELEISNRNFLGVQDLSVKVAPYNNRIAIDHLMWTLTEAAQRAKDDHNP